MLDKHICMSCGKFGARNYFVAEVNNLIQNWY